MAADRGASVEIRTPVRISVAEAASTRAGVKRWSAPSSSDGPYRPQAERNGSDLRRGREENGGMPLAFSGGSVGFEDDMAMGDI